VSSKRVEEESSALSREKRNTHRERGEQSDRREEERYRVTLKKNGTKDSDLQVEEPEVEETWVCALST